MSNPWTSVSLGTWLLPKSVPDTDTWVPSAIAPRTLIRLR